MILTEHEINGFFWPFSRSFYAVFIFGADFLRLVILWPLILLKNLRIVKKLETKVYFSLKFFNFYILSRSLSLSLSSCELSIISFRDFGWVVRIFFIFWKRYFFYMPLEYTHCSWVLPFHLHCYNYFSFYSSFLKHWFPDKTALIVCIKNCDLAKAKLKTTWISFTYETEIEKKNFLPKTHQIAFVISLEWIGTKKWDFENVINFS